MKSLTALRNTKRLDGSIIAIYLVFQNKHRIINLIQKGEKMSSKEGFKLLTKKYLDDADVSMTTKQSYERILQQFVDYANTLSDLPTRSDVMAYRDYLFKRKLEETTIKYHLVVYEISTVGITRTVMEQIHRRGLRVQRLKRSLNVRIYLKVNPDSY